MFSKTRITGQQAVTAHTVMKKSVRGVTAGPFPLLVENAAVVMLVREGSQLITKGRVGPADPGHYRAFDLIMGPPCKVQYRQKLPQGGSRWLPVGPRRNCKNGGVEPSPATLVISRTSLAVFMLDAVHFDGLLGSSFQHSLCSQDLSTLAGMRTLPPTPC